MAAKSSGRLSPDSPGGKDARPEKRISSHAKVRPWVLLQIGFILLLDAAYRHSPTTRNSCRVAYNCAQLNIDELRISAGTGGCPRGSILVSSISTSKRCAGIKSSWRNIKILTRITVKPEPFISIGDVCTPGATISVCQKLALCKGRNLPAVGTWPLRSCARPEIVITGCPVTRETGASVANSFICVISAFGNLNTCNRAGYSCKR
jgi:hypothetical protein